VGPEALLIRLSVKVATDGASEYGLADGACHVIGCYSTQETSVQNALRDVAGKGPGRYCSSRHRMPFNSTDEGSQSVG